MGVATFLLLYSSITFTLCVGKVKFPLILNIFVLHIAYQKVTMLVLDKFPVELNQYLKFQGGNLLITTWNIAFQSLKN